jgi:hypothetical protein
MPLRGVKDEISFYGGRKPLTTRGAGGTVEFKTASGLSHDDTPQYAPQFLEAARWLNARWQAE